MKSANQNPQPEIFADTAAEPPELPGLRSWRGVYFFVIGCFIFYVVVLAILSRAFS
jgi:hypothetical protein